MKVACNVLSCAALVCTAIAAAGACAAEAPSQYPSKPIRVIIPGPAAGPADVVARAVGESLAEMLGPLVYDNRAGAAGMIGAEIVARAAPDGYTLLMSHSGPLDLGPLLTRSPPFDPLKDFTHISLVVSMPMLLLVNPNVQAKTVAELIALAKSRPGKLNYASGGPGTGIHMAAEMLKLATHVHIVHVPYKGATPGMTALMSGEVDMMFNGLPNALSAVKSGRLRALAVAGAKRTPMLPELPTISESGIAFDYSGWYGLLGPAGITRPIAAKILMALEQALASPAMKARAATLGLDIIAGDPDQLAARIRNERAKMIKVIAATGMKAE